MLCLRLVVLVLNYLLGFGAVTAYVDRQRPINFGSSHQSSSQGSQAQNSKCVSETFKICKENRGQGPCGCPCLPKCCPTNKILSKNKAN
eukprot:08745.XXX_148824_148494_1 [CDS] Oithona nana genome sequencing.